MAPLWLRFVCILGALIACTAVAVPDDPAPTAADEKAIQATLEKLAAAFNARDAKAAVALFTPTGEFVDGEGNTFHGREAIEAELTALFKANTQGKVGFETDNVRFLSAGLFIEEGTVTVTSVDKFNKKIGYLMLHAQQKDGSWLLASVRSKGEEATTPQEHLQELSWLIGEWVDESTESVVKTRVRWSEDKNFILSDFVIQVAGKPTLKGTHRIGWDPLMKSFKSWVFDSAGGHAEGVWTQVDERWIVRFTGVRPDGEVGTMTTTYQPIGPDTYLYTVTDRILGEDAQPDLSVLVVRKPPEPAKAATK
jgi:uncharacterized protein (TIGR02246 family)